MRGRRKTHREEGRGSDLRNERPTWTGTNMLDITLEIEDNTVSSAARAIKQTGPEFANTHYATNCVNKSAGPCDTHVIASDSNPEAAFPNE